MYTELTPEQEALIPKYRDEWFKIGVCTDPADRPVVEDAITQIYEITKRGPPEFIWARSPSEALTIIAERKFGGDIQQARSEIWNTLHGQTNAYWIAFYLYCRDVVGVKYEMSRELELCAQLARSGSWWWPYEEFCVCCERPLTIAWGSTGPDQTPTLVNLEGPAISFRDGFEMYAINGVRVPKKYVMAPESLTIDEIDGQTNQELRRIAIERYNAKVGPGAYILNSGAVKIHEDKWGKLWHKAARPNEEEPTVMVQVLNATAESDGHFKEYWLRVPPTVKTAHEAVAWTFELTAEEYNPQQET